MSTLKVIGTGSTGNCYLIECNNEILVLDCGCKYSDVLKTLNFDLTNVVGCLVGHFHIDHSKYMKDFKKNGIPVFAPYLDNSKLVTKIGHFSVQAFPVPHDGTENYAFLIRNGKETFLYATDFEYIKFKLNKCHINHYIVECNYQEKYIDNTAANSNHKWRGHCSLETLSEFLQANITDDMEDVTIIHMGSGCDPRECVEVLHNILPDKVSIDYARKGDIYQLTSEKRKT